MLLSLMACGRKFPGICAYIFSIKTMNNSRNASATNSSSNNRTINDAVSVYITLKRTDCSCSHFLYMDILKNSVGSKHDMRTYTETPYRSTVQAERVALAGYRHH